jgi:hypothetical protein
MRERSGRLEHGLTSKVGRGGWSGAPGHGLRPARAHRPVRHAGRGGPVGTGGNDQSVGSGRRELAAKGEQLRRAGSCLTESFAPAAPGGHGGNRPPQWHRTRHLHVARECGDIVHYRTISHLPKRVQPNCRGSPVDGSIITKETERPSRRIRAATGCRTDTEPTRGAQFVGRAIRRFPAVFSEIHGQAVGVSREVRAVQARTESLQS